MTLWHGTRRRIEPPSCPQPPNHITVVGVYSSPHLLCGRGILHSGILKSGVVRHHENPTLSGNHAKRSSAPLFQQNKSFTLSEKRPIWNQRERLHCSPSLLLSSTTSSSCCAGLAARRGFFILVSLLEVRVPWDVESEKTLPCFPSFFFQPFPAVPLGWRAAHFIFHEKLHTKARDRTARRGPCGQAIPRMTSPMEACERAHVPLQMVSHAHTHKTHKHTAGHLDTA